MSEIKQRSDCPISYALDFFGDKWTFLIIRDLIFDGKKYYKDFLQSKEGIATNILSDRLKKLEKIGVVEARVDEELRNQKIYTLTQKGKDLVPVMVEVILWSNKHKSGLNIDKTFLKKVKVDKEAVIKFISDRIG